MHQRKYETAAVASSASASPNGAKHESVVARKAKNALILIVCTAIWHYAAVFDVMLKSKRMNSSLLYCSFALFSFTVLIGLYLTWIVGRTNVKWDKDPMYSKYIHAATISMLLGGALWIAALWPVFHVWTIPLGLVGSTGAMMLVLLMPSATKTKV